MRTLHIPRPTGYSLDAASAFYAGFLPGSGMAAASVEQLTLAFRLDGSHAAVAVALTEEGDALRLEVAGTMELAAVTRQVARMLGLDGDAAAWTALGERDALVGRLQAEFPGFFTAAKASPYDAATWGVIVTRTSMQQAARIKMALAAQHGDAVSLHGRTHHVFPSPTQLLRVESFAGLSEEKLRRLHGLAEAALSGKLDAEHLRKLPEHVALAELQTLRGIGPWTAGHILHRGAAPHDTLPTTEPRILHGLAHAMGSEVPSVESFIELAESWRPFRMWVCILLSRHLQRAGLWNAPELPKARARLGRRSAGVARRA